MFLDTSGLLSLYDSRDSFHQDAVREFHRADRLLTHNYVLAELVALVNARNLPRRDALDYIRDLLDHPLIEVLWVDEAFHRAGLNLLSHRTDKSHSLCDAISFLQMHERGITEALTADRHFEQEGLVRLLTHTA
jgi:predicted nucleic acid-binding protein